MNRDPKTQKILLVDDEPFMLMLLTRQLANLGFREVSCHENGTDALAVMENTLGAIDLVFCDLQMPQMDGVEFVRHLVRIGYCGGLVLVSGEDERVLQTVERLAQAHKLNIMGSLHKPVSPNLLMQVMEKNTALTERAPRVGRKIYGPSELQRAIAGGELVNYYQPKVEIASATLTGVETLVRWQHPHDGLVLPDQFISTAEEHGLISDLSQAVLIGALAQARIWQDAGLDFRVAVNISMDNLVALEFPDFVDREVRKAGIPLNNLILEVTESRLMKDQLAPLDILTRLRLKHIGLSIDDFGTGHSSLAQLRDIPFDELKVDQSFVHGAAKDASLRAIVEASLNMARHLGMKTVAEGVEDREDWDYLRSTSCDTVQGYFIAKPMPARDLDDWIASWEMRRMELLQLPN